MFRHFGGIPCYNHHHLGEFPWRFGGSNLPRLTLPPIIMVPWKTTRSCRRKLVATHSPLPWLWEEEYGQSLQFRLSHLTPRSAFAIAPASFAPALTLATPALTLATPAHWILTRGGGLTGLGKTLISQQYHQNHQDHQDHHHHHHHDHHHPLLIIHYKSSIVNHPSSIIYDPSPLMTHDNNNNDHHQTLIAQALKQLCINRSGICNTLQGTNTSPW